jgi:hypothetical protein
MATPSNVETPVEATVNAIAKERVVSIALRIADDLSTIVDRTLALSNVTVEKIDARVAGKGVVHIAFKLRFERAVDALYGALLVPLPDALALAGCLTMMPDDQVALQRKATELDAGMKDAIVELGNFVAGAVDAVMRESRANIARARSAGCQGVRADVRPAFPYTEGQELVLVRATARLHEFEPFELLLMLPNVFEA